MVKQKMSMEDWWDKWFKVLKGLENEAKALYQKTGKAYEKGGLWPAAKLITLAYYMPAYLEIIKKYSFGNEIYYIDTCSGCGLTKIGDRIFFGSALLAEKTTSNSKTRSFDKLLFIDNNPENVSCLDSIIDHQRSRVITGDLNDTLPHIIDELESNNKAHFLCVVDPEGMEVSWDTMEILLRSKGDIVFNYQSAAIARELNIPKVENTMNKFFGDDSWKKCMESPEKVSCLFEHYLSRYKALAGNS